MNFPIRHRRCSQSNWPAGFNQTTAPFVVTLRHVNLGLKINNLLQLIPAQLSLPPFLMVFVGAERLLPERQMPRIRHHIHTRWLARFRVSFHQRSGLDIENIIWRHHIFHIRQRTRTTKN